MNTDVLERMDALVKNAASSNPYELAKYLHVDVEKLIGSDILAFVVNFSGVKIVGLNPKLKGLKEYVVLMHEIAHIFFHMDFLTRYGNGYGEECVFKPLKRADIVRQEYEANLIAAEFCLDTGDILDKLGYNSHSLQDYMEHLEKFKQYCAEYKQFMGNTIFRVDDRWTQKRLMNYEKQLKFLQEELEDMQRDLTYEGGCMTTVEIAKEYGIPDTIVEYKIEALHHRGYIVPSVELASYGQVFR